MPPPKKPGDETISGVPEFGKPSDSFIGDTPTGSHKVVSGEAAPEVSQGAWRERVFTPRAVLSKEEIAQGLEKTLRGVLAGANHAKVAFEEVRREWLPFLRQALEQAGGDGLDCWLLLLFDPPGRKPLDPLFDTMAEAVVRLRGPKELAGFEEEALKAMETINKGLALDKPRRLSFKQMEKLLEGKLEVDELFNLRVSDDAELTRRFTEIASTIESIRDQLKAMPGAKPDGMFSNFARLKVELRVIDGELKRRGVLVPGKP